VADFNGALAPERTIASAIWRCQNPGAVGMSEAAIHGRSTSILAAAQMGAGATIKCQITADDGTVVNQVFVVRVLGGPWFQGETTPQPGPYELTATA
jgi:hypothetical protein